MNCKYCSKEMTLMNNIYVCSCGGNFTHPAKPTLFYTPGKINTLKLNTFTNQWDKID
jgi:hypothetical protein